MNFNNHSNLSGCHAPFSASQYHWLFYSDEKAIDVYYSKKAVELGTKYHDWAKRTIDLGIKQPRSKNTLSMYVNDAIGYKMDTEIVLFYSRNFFGTADAISFRNNYLRIHDLKTGKHPAKFEQLIVYAALFCLEYRFEPDEIKMELRIYQNDQVNVLIPEANDVSKAMEKIKHLDELINNLKG